MNLYQQQKTIEDQVLDNYVLLKEVILGEKRLIVPPKPKIQEVLEEKCRMCKETFQPRSIGALYCGNRQTREGCAYKRAVEVGVMAGKRTQLIKKYNQLKTIWEQEE